MPTKASCEPANFDVMKKKWLFAIPIVLMVLFLSRPTDSDIEYIESIHQHWEEKHEFFASSQASPFVQEGKPYNKVDYFAPDIAYQVTGQLERFTQRETLALGNSDGTTSTYLKFAMVRFKINDTPCQLLILKALGFGNQYLLAFGDATSGETTYGGGRYLDVIIGKSDQVTLDFNKAYNPYCAYLADYTCPLPPLENLLEVAIPAGEKDYPY